MQIVVKWTPTLDEQLCQLRHGGLTWDKVALELRLGRNTVLERGRKIGAKRGALTTKAGPEDSRDRPPLQAGHPASWGLIIQGTTLEGEAYPYPVFL
jgi:hypothetical protein